MVPSIPNASSRYGASSRITGVIPSSGAGACFPIISLKMRPVNDAGMTGAFSPEERYSASALWTSTGAPVAPASAAALPV